MKNSKTQKQATSEDGTQGLEAFKNATRMKEETTRGDSERQMAG
jgi:hypothetical protein